MSRGCGYRRSRSATTVKKDSRIHLLEPGAMDAEAEFMVQGRNAQGKWEGQRVVLNAMTSPQLVAWVERQLTAQGVAKVVPDEATLAAAHQRAQRGQHIQAAA